MSKKRIEISSNTHIIMEVMSGVAWNLSALSVSIKLHPILGKVGLAFLLIALSLYVVEDAFIYDEDTTEELFNTAKSKSFDMALGVLIGVSVVTFVLSIAFKLNILCSWRTSTHIYVGFIKYIQAYYLFAFKHLKKMEEKS